ncbi:HAD hydrolase-like protein [Salimicrobium halophilum]|uniref:Adenosylhomocysteine nucleosidase n=1 Tax=Salimicrobium halophilum TaxID=86666 RepID=A0A1G8R3I2_9BACI|nr:HAD hydrolase-like protein [Salimicrobium halophilum]SDJ11532.1 adenosylhomocysteine nucleosidase [Salimicrobium halophilum]
MTKAIIFDMDGTLFQTEMVLEHALEAVFSDLRSEGKWEGAAPVETYKEIMGVPLPVVWDTLLPKETDKVKEEMNERFQTYLISSIQEGKGALYPHVLETLADLKEEGYTLLVASNGLPDYLKAIVETYHLDHYISDVFSIARVASGDKGELVEKACNSYGVTKGMGVGDRLSDFKAAHRNRLKAIGCRFDFSKEEELKEADIIIDDLQELMNI